MADPNHIVLHNEGLVFALPAKSANTSVKVAVARATGRPVTGQPPTYHVHHQDRGPFPHIALADVPRGYDVVGVIREPVRRAWSCWRYSYAHRTFGQFVAWLEQTPDAQTGQHERGQWLDLTVAGEVIPTRWLVVETLADDWVALCRDRGWPDVPMTHENRSTRGEPYHEAAVSPDLASRIRARWSQDVALYADVCGRRVSERVPVCRSA